MRLLIERERLMRACEAASEALIRRSAPSSVLECMRLRNTRDFAWFLSEAPGFALNFPLNPTRSDQGPPMREWSPHALGQRPPRCRPAIRPPKRVMAIQATVLPPSGEQHRQQFEAAAVPNCQQMRAAFRASEARFWHPSHLDRSLFY